MKVFLFFLFLVIPQISTAGTKILSPVKTKSPRESIQTFMLSMETYRLGVEYSDSTKEVKISNALRTFDLEEFSPLIKLEKGRTAAIYLKEIFDRIGLPKLAKIPNIKKTESLALNSWVVPDTEIYLVKIQSGARQGEYLFSKSTVERSKEFFDKVKHLPYINGKFGASYKEPWVDKFIPKWSKEFHLGMFTWQWLGIFFSLILGLLVKRIIQYFVHLVKKVTNHSRIKWDDRLVEAVEKPIGLLGASVFWYFCIQALQFEGFVQEFFLVIVQVFFSYSAIWMAYRAVDAFTVYLKNYANNSNTAIDDQLVPLLTRAIRLFVVIFGILVAIQNLGVNVMSLLAGLGLGGLAFALAAKDAAANLFGSIMILWDQPFRAGDWVVIGDEEGTVEEIGFRSTRIRTFYNSVITLPNSVVANANIDNMGKREFRRVRTELGVCYDTSPEKMELFLEGIKNIIKANPNTRKDYYHVVFNSYGPSSLNILLYFFLIVPDWSEELVVKQNVFLEILRLAKTLEVEFAFPTQSIHIASNPKSATTENKMDIDGLKSSVVKFGPGGEFSKPSGLGLFTPPYAE